jgi:hypothetical protein
MLFGAVMGGTTGGNSLGGGWGVAGGLGKPGIFGIPGMAAGGTVAGAGLSWVGEEGPELLRLPAGASIIPNGPAMALGANQSQANDNGGAISLHIENHIDARGATKDAAPEIARHVTASIKAQIPDMIASYNKNPYRRKTANGSR